MAVLVNRAKMTTATTGTGTITLGSALGGFQTFTEAGVTNGQTVQYCIEDAANFEIGTGVFTASGTTLTRSVSESSNSNNAINLSGTAIVFITAVAADLTSNVAITGGNISGIRLFQNANWKWLHFILFLHLPISKSIDLLKTGISIERPIPNWHKTAHLNSVKQFVSIKQHIA